MISTVPALVLVLLAVFTTAMSVWLVKKLINELSKRQIVDNPNERSMHQGRVPLGGGLVIVFAVSVGIIILALFDNRYLLWIGLLTTVLAWACLGWWDDRHDLSPRFRFLIQLEFAVLGIVSFGYVNPVYVAPRIWFDLVWLAPFVSLIGLVWMANLYNFMDGMDGLAAGQTIIAGITLSIWFTQSGDAGLGLLCVILAASSYGFLWWNWRPAKIFMGDVGSISIGALFATLMIIATTRYQIPIIASVILFGVFICDTSITLMRRFIRGEQISQAHRTHYYQRLANVGIAHEKIVIGALVCMFLCSLIASVAASSRDMIGLAVLLFTVLMTVVFLLVNTLEKRLLKEAQN